MKFPFLILISIILISCDPENDFYLKGKISDKNNESKITNVKVEFIYFTNNIEWKINRGFMETEFDIDLGNIELNKKLPVILRKVKI